MVAQFVTADTHVVAVSGMDGIEFLSAKHAERLIWWTQTETAPFAGPVDLSQAEFQTEPFFEGDVVPSLEEQRAAREATLRVRFVYYFLFKGGLRQPDLEDIKHAMQADSVECPTPYQL